MNNVSKILCLIIFVFISSFKLFSQEITEENYLKLDKEIWELYELEAAKLLKLFESNDQKKDSLILEFDRIYKIAQRKNRETAIKFASVPSGLKRVYMLRVSISKDTLRSILNELPMVSQESYDGENIRLYIETKQIEAGDNVYNFHATDSYGKPFQISNLKGKNILLLYGGLGCMGEEGRHFLKNYYNSIDNNNFKIIVYDESSSSVEELNAGKMKYGSDYLFISDFKGDRSPMKINYGAQGTPTCFIINKNGIVIHKSLGLPEKELTNFKS